MDLLFHPHLNCFKHRIPFTQIIKLMRLVKHVVVHLSSERVWALGCLGFCWDEISQLCGDCNKTIKRIPVNQLVQWKVGGWFLGSFGYHILVWVRSGNQDFTWIFGLELHFG